MSKYSLAHLSDSALLAGTNTLVERDRATTAELIAHLAEVDARALYLPEGYPSIFAWCVGALRFSRDSAHKRIRAARLARRFPALLPMLADGRLTLSAVGLLATYLTTDNAADLLSAAAGRTNEEIELLLAERFPKSDVLALVTALGAGRAPAGTSDEGAPKASIRETQEQVAVRPLHVPVRPACDNEMRERARVTPLAAGRFALQATIDQETFDALEYARALLGHSVPSGDLAQVLDRALKALVAQLEKQRFAKCARSRPSLRRGEPDPRSIPAAVRRIVWERDGGCCTFTSESGHRCGSRERLEYDHIEPVGRGGASTPSNLRLRCRAHNQMTAERTYGREFMRHKREEAKRAAAREREAKRAAERERRAAEAKERETARVAERASRAAEAKEREAALAADRERQAPLQALRDDVVKALRNLGYGATEAKEASRVVDSMPGATLEHLLRAALRLLLPRSVRIERYGAEADTGSNGANAAASALGG